MVCWVKITLFANFKCHCEKTIHFQTFCKKLKVIFLPISINLRLILKYWSPLLRTAYLICNISWCTLGASILYLFGISKTIKRRLRVIAQENEFLLYQKNVKNLPFFVHLHDKISKGFKNLKLGKLLFYLLPIFNYC